MSIDRRRFIQLAAMTALAEGGCCPKTKFIQGTPVPGDDEKPKLEPNLLGIDFQGLYLIEERPSAISVHLLDAPLLGMPAHLLQMRALKSTIDLSQTQEPDQYHRAPAGSDEWWMWDLKGMQVTTPASSSGQNDLTPIGSSSEDNLDIPTSSEGWNSQARIADLKVLCGASRINKPDKLAASIALTHGRVDVLKPTGIGSRTVWEFSDGDKVLMLRAISDLVRYSCPTDGQKLAINVGTTTIVFLATGSLVEVRNVAMDMKDCPGCKPSMKHFPVFFKVVDQTLSPKICLAKQLRRGALDAGPDYCPGGRI